tara:strand:+ start:295 stop:522 length:228 start_codon:yes stop_codon:yes gene_type:complete
MTKKELLRQQTDLVQRMIYHGLNLVDCGNCGSTLIHETHEGDITCPFCEYTSEPCDFPDHFYEGFEESAEFQDNE